MGQKEMWDHDLKILPEYYEAVLEGRKSFEIRKNDRGFHEGHILKLSEYDPDRNLFTGNSLTVIVKYLTDYEQKDDFVVMGFDRL